MPASTTSSSRPRRQALSGEPDVRCVLPLQRSLLGLAALVAAQPGHCGRLPSHRTLGLSPVRGVETYPPDQGDELGRHFRSSCSLSEVECQIGQTIAPILNDTPNSGGNVATFLNVGRMDRSLRVALGIGLGIAGILVNGHPHLGWALGIAGVLVILSGTCGI